MRKNVTGFLVMIKEMEGGEFENTVSDVNTMYELLCVPGWVLENIGIIDPPINLETYHS